MLGVNLTKMRHQQRRIIGPPPMIEVTEVWSHGSSEAIARYMVEAPRTEDRRR